jgi:DNA-binding NarL/FixJ family response regulator
MSSIAMATETEVLRIMIVDDQEPVRRALRGLLKTQPTFDLCGEAQDGMEAVEKASELRPQVVLMDVSMPRLDGLEATRQILKALPDTEVLILTQHDSEQAARAAKDAGARGYLSKSDARYLISAVETVSRHIPFFPSKFPPNIT